MPKASLPENISATFFYLCVRKLALTKSEGDSVFNPLTVLLVGYVFG